MSTITSAIKAAKDPSDIKDYDIDWADVLTGESETALTSSTWSASDPAGLTVLAAPPYLPSIVGTKCIVWVSGGTAGTKYTLTNTVVTAGATPRTHQKSIIIPCGQQ